MKSPRKPVSEENARYSRTHRAAEINASEKQASFGDRLDVLKRVLTFGPFLGSSFEPSISDREIIVCFVDVRGFTGFCRRLQMEMQDLRIQHFLKAFFSIF